MHPISSWKDRQPFMYRSKTQNEVENNIVVPANALSPGGSTPVVGVTVAAKLFSVLGILWRLHWTYMYENHTGDFAINESIGKSPSDVCGMRDWTQSFIIG